MDVSQGKPRRRRAQVRIHATAETRVPLNLSMPSELVTRLKALALLRRVSVSSLVEAWAVGVTKGVVAYQRAEGSGALPTAPGGGDVVGVQEPERRAG